MDKNNIIMNPKIALNANISNEDWIALLFETGCMFVEKRISSSYIKEQLLEAAEGGFWAWWIKIFLDDDERLLKTGCGATFLKMDYKSLKEDLANFKRIETVDIDWDHSIIK